MPGCQLHILIIPSWYPQFEGDPGGSFFREQAIGLTRQVERVGVIFPNQRSIRELWNPKALPFGITDQNDAGTLLMQRNGFNITPRWETGVATQFLRHGARLFSEYAKRHGKPDVIHAHSALYGGLLAHRISEATGIPYVITEHASGYFKNHFNSKQLALARTVFARSSANLSVSKNLEKILQERYCFGGVWKVMPNIVNASFFAQPLDTAQQNSRRKAFINVAQLNPNKRHDLLIEAIAICQSLGRKDLTLTIAGEGGERASLQQRIMNLGLGDHVHLKGMVPRDQVPALLAAHEAFVLASDYETFGVVVAEALAMGMPCVVTNCGGPADILTSEDGCTVETGDAKAIAEAMIKTADRPFDLAERLERRNRCSALFSENAVSQQLASLYHQVVFSQCQ